MKNSPLRQSWRAGAVLPAILAVGAIALTGCTDSPRENTSRTTPAAGTPAGEPTDTPTSGPTPIVLEFGGQAIRGELDDSATAGSLLGQLPLTLPFRDFGGQEKIAELPEPLDLTGAPEESGAEPLTIGYYAPSQSLVLYYDQVSSFPGIVPIGAYADSDAVVESQTAEFSITIRRAD